MGFGSVGKSESTYSVDESENANQMKQFTVSENDVKLGEKKKKNKMSGAMKALLVVLLLALVAVVVLAVVIIKIRDDDKEVVKDTQEELADRYKETCLTPTCVSAAARIMNNIDASVHPCDNFYDFACGGWVKKHELTEDRPRISVLSEYVEEVDEEVQRILEEPPSDDDLKSVRSAKNLFQSCLDMETIGKRGGQPFKNWLVATIGHWPLISSAEIGYSFELTDVLIDAGKKGSFPLVQFFVGVDPRNTGTHVLKLDQPRLGMQDPASYLVPRNDPTLMAYQNYIYKVAQNFGFLYPTSGQRNVKAIVDFEIKLAKSCVPLLETGYEERPYIPMTLAELDKKYLVSEFSFTMFVKSLLTAPEIGVTDVTDDEIIINFSDHFFGKLEGIFRTVLPSVVENYVYWRIAQDYLEALSQPYLQLNFEFYKVLRGIDREQPRDSMCASYTKRTIGLAVDKAYVEQKGLLQPEAKTMLQDMIGGLQSAFNEQVDELSWMDADTKRLAKQKNGAIKSKFAYLELLTNDVLLNEVYVNYTFQSDKYFENYVTVMRLDYEKSMRKLRKPVHTNAWSMSLVEVNASYNPSKNEMDFSAGILQPPFYSKDSPKFLNYGGIGTVTGRELTHGFDYRGRQFDKTGHLKQWWSDSSTQMFKDKAQCFVDQYSAYVTEVAHMNVSEIEPLGENIAASGGIRQAFRAYRSWVKARGKDEQTLPGINYSSNQLFFINSAQLWCSQEGKEAVFAHLGMDSHISGRYRVIGENQNSEDFSREFNCSKTSYMNPEKKCRVW
ncbi:membrane metallo-endopeptidase-like 1 [Aplysia californica]|uniref:Membrane metallo-endopeptidase-like 1 n=1 Tax=Aplysia californica TaxID=6500 RepID=A0ABM1AE18_APLCA|nr:membrane metallo-endopeptidase-like 1 [Aplysia californica]